MRKRNRLFGFIPVFVLAVILVASLVPSGTAFGLDPTEHNCRLEGYCFDRCSWNCGLDDCGNGCCLFSDGTPVDPNDIVEDFTNGYSYYVVRGGLKQIQTLRVRIHGYCNCGDSPSCTCDMQYSESLDTCMDCTGYFVESHMGADVACLPLPDEIECGSKLHQIHDNHLIEAEEWAINGPVQRIPNTTTYTSRNSSEHSEDNYDIFSIAIEKRIACDDPTINSDDDYYTNENLNVYGDPIFDCIDNCPFISNGDQSDCDGDGVGDVCDCCDMTLEPDKTVVPPGQTVLIQDGGCRSKSAQDTWEVELDLDDGVILNPPVFSSPEDKDFPSVTLSAMPDSKQGYARITVTSVTYPDCSATTEIYFGCQSCQNGGECGKGGSCDIKNGSIDARFFLGQDRHGVSSGTLALRSDTMSTTPSLSSPEALELYLNGKTYLVRDREGRPSQVVSEQTCAEFEIIGPDKYLIHFYRVDPDAFGYYAPAHYEIDYTTETPITTWTIEKPSGSTNTLSLTEDKSGNETVYTYQYDDATSTWSLARGDGGTPARVITKAETTHNGYPAEIETIIDGSGNPSAKTRTTYKDITCGSHTRRLIVEEVVDPDGLGLTTVTDYYEEGTSCGLVESRQFPDGSWVRYEYDELSRKTKEVRSWLDQPFGALESDARVITYDYNPIPGSGDTDSDDYILRPRTITETIPLNGNPVEVSTDFYVYKKDSAEISLWNYETTYYWVTEIHEIAADQSAEYGNVNNQREEIETCLPVHKVWGGRIKKRVRLDNTRDDYYYYPVTYSLNGSEPGTTTFGGDDLLVRVEHGTADQPGGIDFKTTAEQYYIDEKGQELCRLDMVHVGETQLYTRSWAVNSYNPDGHLTDTWYKNGTSSHAVWDCCHRTSQTDIYGTVTNYNEYDALGRLIQFEKNGITTTYTYDASGRRLTETVSAPGLEPVTRQNIYDMAGRLVSATDNGLTTFYSYDANNRTTTVTRPGGAQEITTNYADGRIKSITGSGVVDQHYTYGVNSDGSRWTRVDIGSKPSPRFEITTYDMAGNVIRVEKPSSTPGVNIVVKNDYDRYGHLIKTTTTDDADNPLQAAAIYKYDELGNMYRSGLDVDQSGALEPGSMDRIQDTNILYDKDGTEDWWLITTNSIFAADNNDTATTTGIQKNRVSGLINGLTDETISVDIHGNETISTTTIDGANHTVTRTVTYPDSSIPEVTVTENGRVVSQTSKTGVTRTFGYDDLGRRTSVKDPRIGTSSIFYTSQGRVDYVLDADGNKTGYTYDPATGRQVAVANAKGDTTRFAYAIDGKLEKKWGSAVEPVQFEYDSYGQMAQMHMFRGGSGWDATAWPEGTAGDPDITIWDYDPATGLLASKIDDDGNATDYAYTIAGKLSTRTWARQGGNSLVTTYGYDSATGDLTSIDYSDTTPDVTYTYNRSGQIQQVTDVVGTRTFSYNSALQMTTEAIDGSDGGLYSKTITRTYDASSVPGRSTGFSLTGYSAEYEYDTTGRMNKITWNTGGDDKIAAYTYVPKSDLLDKLTMNNLVTDYDYELRRDLKTQVKHTFNGTDVVYDYTYNKIGQRDRMDMTPDLLDNLTPEAGTTTYTPDNLNQYDAITVDGTPQTPAPQYDEDGNMTQLDGMTFTWNGENRMAVAENSDTRVEYAYDYMGRRVKKSVLDKGTSQTTVTLFVYDGWNLIQELNASQAVQRAYVWGLDLSQSLQGAGGVGGLLAMYDGTNTYLYCHDANGNVGRMVNAADGTVAAAYEYAAFGGIVHQSGGMADDNVFRFSTKYWDDETGLYYYGYRYYLPETGRWLNRDPLGEKGGLNLYGFVGNDAIGVFDDRGDRPHRRTREHNRRTNLRIRYNRDRLNSTHPSTTSTCNWCGPDVSDELAKELNDAYYDWISGYSNYQNIFSWLYYRIYIRYRAMSDIGPGLDFLAIDYATTVNGHACPSGDQCERTYEICGKCVHDHFMGNIMYGFWMKLFGFKEVSTYGFGHGFQFLGPSDDNTYSGAFQPDLPYDQAGYEMGFDLYDSRHGDYQEVSLCSVIGGTDAFKRANETGKDISKCQLCR